jgi:fatty acid desaturase/rubredoxin
MEDLLTGSKFNNDLAVNWYRTPVEPKLLQILNLRSDVSGFAQAGGFLGLMVLSGGLAIYVQQQFAWWLLIPALLLHGSICAFMTNAEHELVHGTVFRRPWLNQVFLKLFGFLRWFPYDYYWASHTEHHKHTLYPPHDQEVVLPTHFTLAGFLKEGFVDPARLLELFRTNLRHGRGRLEGDWETYLLARDPVRYAVFRWARILLAGHCAIALVSIYYGYWIIPVVVSLTPCYGGWLFWLCNNTQHAGLKDKTSDFRLNSRTMYLNPVLEFLYWHMNFHSEHHMYAAVPCYNLRRLHEAIKHDCPPATHGLLSTWRQMIGIQRRQKVEPDYQYVPPLPGAREESSSAPEVLASKPLLSAASDDDSAAQGGPGRLWECTVCGFVYSERLGLPNEGFPPGTAWEDIPDDWVCPDCGTSKADFEMVEIAVAKKSAQA